ncbi:MAG TPA: hypothetical protein VEW45_02330 [Candidatus Dormibacteraeota bacterium]|nr:hypothetical protein [Candidatus Dormibacteraeota bacterium]
MSNEPIVIELEGEDTEGHASVIQVTPDDEEWLKDLGDSKKSVRIRIPADDDDTEGHLAAAIVSVVINDDDDDTEGHALRLQFPSVKEADQFRRNVMAAGLITATIALGAIGGAALGSAAGNAVNDSAAISGQSSVANQGQFTVENQGGTALSQRQAANQGQYDATNMGGTPAAAAANQGQYDATNMGGTPAAAAENQGQYDADNLGGTPQAPSAQDDGDEVHRQPDPNRNLPR